MEPTPRKFGVLFPPGNVTMERELPPLLPPEVSMHCNRLSRPDSSLSPASLAAMAQSVGRAARDLAQTDPEIIVYGCTSGSFIGGEDEDEAIAAEIEQATGIPAVTTATAVRRALRALEVRSLYMVTPYPDELNRAETVFLAFHGIEVIGCDTFGCQSSEEIRRISSDAVADMVLRHADEIAGCDGVFISCTQLLSCDRIGTLEARLGKPVVSSNQASLWAALDHMGVDASGRGGGRLLDRLAGR